MSLAANTKGMNNSVGVAVGVRSSDAIKNMMFYEYYDTGAGILRVYVPVAVIGAGYTYESNPYGMIDTECLYASVRNMYLPHVGMQIWQADTFGINATGTLADQGTPPITKAQNDLMGDAFWTSAEALLKGTPVGTWSSMFSTYVTAARAVVSPNREYFLPPLGGSAAGLQVIHSYNVINNTAWYGYGQSPTYNVFGTSMYVEADINKTDFSTYPPGNWTFGVYGSNWMNTHSSGCVSGQVQAASFDLDLYAYPAIEVEGTISAGTPLPNLPLTLSDGDANVYTFSTNAAGNYRFFAKPGTTYTLSATYTTPFETASAQRTFTTGTDPTGLPQYADLNFATSDIHGRVTDNAGLPISGAKVSIGNNSAGPIWCCQYTDSNGYYQQWFVAKGSYNLTAAQWNYYSQTATVKIGKLGTSYVQNFALTPTAPPLGGCVLSGTLIATPGGTRKVDVLAAGNVVLGYDVATGAWVQETVTSNTYTHVNLVLSVNGGSLKATPTEQPLYVRNGTWVGWVQDPQNLSVGEQLFNPTTGSWVSITALQALQGTFKVYDLRVASPYDFIANGFLTLDKRR